MLQLWVSCVLTAKFTMISYSEGLLRAMCYQYGNQIVSQVTYKALGFLKLNKGRMHCQ